MIPKFRAWGKKENKMFEVMCLGLAKGAKTELWSSIKYHHLSVVPSVLKKYYVLMQSTGLKDKNGKEIFKGDVVKQKIEVYNPAGCQPTGKDRWRYILTHGECLLRFQPDWKIKPSLLEVIGNIYENPDLIKEMNS